MKRTLMVLMLLLTLGSVALAQSGGGYDPLNSQQFQQRACLPDMGLLDDLVGTLAPILSFFLTSCALECAYPDQREVEFWEGQFNSLPKWLGGAFQQFQGFVMAPTVGQHQRLGEDRVGVARLQRLAKIG